MEKTVGIKGPVKTKRQEITGICGTEQYQFSCGNEVPVFEVDNPITLIQLVGYAKFINKDYGNVLLRGENKLHNSLVPGIYRKRKGIGNVNKSLNGVISQLGDDSKLCKDIVSRASDNSKDFSITAEALLQHYGLKTRFLDVVDNHWVALWMGLYKADSPYKNGYICYEKRTIRLRDRVNDPVQDDHDYQYLLLIAIPRGNKRSSVGGLDYDKEFITIDLRMAVSSIFLRPHAQHGIVVRKKGKEGGAVNDYDMATQVVGIIKIRIDLVDQWLGNGLLLTKKGLFPPPTIDQGYAILLKNGVLSSLGKESIIGSILRYCE